MRHLMFGVIALTTIAVPARAQVLDRARAQAEPRFWVSGAIGLFDLGTLQDGGTQSSWRFDDAAQFRGSAEYAVGRGSSLGAVVTWASVPVRYVSSGVLGGATDVTATVSSLGLVFHGGGGSGLHQVIEASAGAVRFSDFTSDDTGDRVEPLEPDYDFTFSLGVGFGFSLGDRAQIQLVQDVGLVLHQKSGLPNDASTTAYSRVTRIGLRYGIGGGPER